MQWMARSALVAIGLAVWITCQAQGGDPEVRTMIDRVEQPQYPNRQGFDSMQVHKLMDWFGVPGMSLAVIHDFEIHWAKAYGTADVESGAPVTTETMFQAASLSKPVTAFALLKAVQDEHFGLDDDINSVLASWQLSGPGVTPRLLASHLSGLGDGFGFPGYEPGSPLPTPIEILRGEGPSNTPAIFLERRPLAAMEYSGGGFVVLQLALVDSLHLTFPEIMSRYVFEPLDMSHTTFEQPLPDSRDRFAARAHDDQGQSRGSKWHVYPELAAAGLWTTPIDLAALVIEIQKSVVGESNRVLSRALAEEMVTPVGVGDYSIGFRMTREGQGWYFNHGGSNWGFVSLLVGHKRKGYGLVVMTNSAGGRELVNEIKRRIERAYGWDSLDLPVPRGY